MTSLSSRKLIYSNPPQFAASQSSSTFTISDISQSLEVTPAAIAGGNFQGLMDANEIVMEPLPIQGTVTWQQTG